MELAIGQVGLSDSDYDRLKRVMASAIIKHAFKCRWVIGKARNANVVVVDADSLDAAATKVDSAEQLLLVLKGTADVLPGDHTTISWPIRYDELVPILLRVESEYVTNDDTSSAPDAESPLPDIDVADSIRTALTKLEQRKGDEANSDGAQEGDDFGSQLVRLARIISKGDGGPGSRAWRVSGIGKSPVFIVPGEPYFYTSGSLAHVSQIGKGLSISTFSIDAVDTSRGKKPLLMLQWLVGINSGRVGLLPWLEDCKAYKLRRYPAFQMLHHTPPHRRIAAALSRPCKNLSQVASITGTDDETVAGFINASSMCGYLLTVDSASASGNARRTGASRRALLQKFRNALGINSVNV